MGRTRIAKAVINDLKEKKESSQKRKNELIEYVKRLNHAHLNEKVSGARYVEILHKKNDGRNIKEWVEYYENYSKNCEREIKNQKRKIIKNKIPVFLFSIVLISIFIYISFNINFNFTGFGIKESGQEFSQDLNLILSENTNYEWQLENIGQLKSVRVNGLIEGEGEVRIYLDDLLIMDSSKIKSKSTSLTGGVIDESAIGEETTGEGTIVEEKIVEENPIVGPIKEKTQETKTQETQNASSYIQPSNTSKSYSETEAPLKEESSPSPGELLTEDNKTGINQTIPQENITQNKTRIEPLNQTEFQGNITQNETEIIIKTFTGICEETCNLKDLNLNKSSYTLRIEIENAKLELNTIDYNIIPEEMLPEEIIPYINATNISSIENVTINTTQYQAILGQPVKWKKEISLDKEGSARIELPKEAENIVVNKIIESYSEVEQEALQKEESSPSHGGLPYSEDGKIKQNINENIETKLKTIEKSEEIEKPASRITGNSIFRNIKNSRITGNAISPSTSEGTPVNSEEIIEVLIKDNSTNYEIEYETPAPYAVEENLTNGKRVKIVGPETIHYENVLIFTNLSENLNIKNPSSIKIHWIENNTYIPPTKVEDRDNNGIYDYIEWVVPHLSNQTFDIIVITKAEHLDSNRNFISDIYEQVKQLDNIWSETISDGDYVRITFEIPLDNTRDITIYPRIISGTPRIEVYEVNSTEKIAEFTNLNSNEYNKIYLTNLGQGQCYDNETKILTENGWKYFYDLNDNEEVATLNPETKKLEWQTPLEQQEFNYNNEMYKIILEDGSDLLVSPEHKVYSAEDNEENDYSLSGNIALKNSGIFNRSDVESTSTSFCLFNASSLDHKGSFNFKANARKSISCESGHDFSKCFNNSWYSSIGINETATAKSLFISLNSSSDNLVFFRMSDLCEFISSNANSGENKLKSILIRNFLTIEPFQKNVYNTLVSATNSIYNSPFFFNESNLPLLEALCNLTDQSIISCSSSEFNCALIFSHSANLRALSTISFLTNADQLNSGNCFINSLISSGIANVNDTILSLPPNYVQKRKYVQVYKSFDEKKDLSDFNLTRIKDVYSNFNSGKEVYFLDENNQPIKVKSIKKENYNGKIYDVDVENDIVLVRHGNENSTAFWSGNSEGYSQDTFDLRVTGGEVEFDHIVDPASTHLYDFSTGSGSDKWAYTFANLDVAAAPHTESSLAPAGEITTAVTTTNLQTYNQQFVTITGSVGDYSPLYLKFTINEDPTIITNISMDVQGIYTQTSGTAMQVWAYNFSNPGYYVQIGGDFAITSTASPGLNFSRYINNRYSDFINGSGTMFILFVDGTANIDEYFDYVRLNVTYTDTVPPTYTEVSTNETVAGNINNFAINVGDNSALHPNGAYIFSTNNSGEWQNDSTILFTTTPSWANVTKILDAVAGHMVGYRWFFNDTSSNTNSTPVYVLTTTSPPPPTYSLVSKNNTVAGKITQFAINVTDSSALHPNGQYIFSTNNTGNWVNDTAFNFTTTPSRVNTTKILNSTIGTFVGYMWYFNNTAGYTNSTSVYTLTTSFPPPVIDFKMCFVRNQQLNNSMSLEDSTKLIISNKVGQVITVNNLPDYDQFDESGWVAMLTNATGTEGVADGDYSYKNFTTINRTAKTLTFAAGMDLSAWAVGYILVLYNPFLNYDFVGNQTYNPFISITGAPAWRNGGTTTTASVSGPMFRHSDGRYIWMFNGYNGTIYRLGYAYSDNMTTWTMGNSDQPIYNYTTEIPDTTRAYIIGHATPLNDGTGRYYSLLYQAQTSTSYNLMRIFYFDENFTAFTYSEPLMEYRESGFVPGSILQIGDKYHLIYMLVASAGVPYRTIIVAKSTSLEGPYTDYQNITRGIDANNGTAWSNNIDAPSIYNDGTKISGLFGATPKWSQSGTKGNREFVLLDFNETTEVWSINEKGPVFINPIYFQDLGLGSTYYLWAGDHLGGPQNLFIDGNNTYLAGSMKGSKYQVSLIKLKDSTPPTYSHNSTNNTLAGEITNFAINVTDNVALHPNGQYIFSTNNTGSWLNDSGINFTSTPSWANVTKTLDAVAGHMIGYRWYFDDNSSNSNSTPIYVLTTTGGDSTPPYFTTIPANSSLFYGNQSLSVDFDATDTVGFGYFSINDTARFSMTQAGILTNATPMAFGNYEINVTINDTSNNINWTRYKVQINKSNYYDCEVYFNATSGINYPDNFIVYTNCSSLYTLYRNQSVINNNTIVSAGAGYYNITVQRTDTANYTNTVDTEFFTVNKNTNNICQVGYNASSGITYPDTFLVWSNCTTPVTLMRNGTTVGNNTVVNSGASAYNFSFLRADTQNYSYIYNESQFIVNKVTPTLTKLLNGNNADFTGVYPIQVNASGYTNYGTLSMYRNATDIISQNNINISIPSGYHQFAFSVTGNANITDVSSQYLYATISQNTTSCSVYFNTTSPVIHPAFFIAYTNCSTTYALTRNGTAISNNSIVNSGATAYNISVQRLDTSNYTNTFNQQQFIINKNPENCRVLFNETSPINYPNTFLAWANCTTEFTLKRNTTVITNYTEQVLAVGAYNFSFLRTDSINYSIYYNQSEFRVVDSTPPTYSHNSTNNTLAGLFSKFAINVSDNSALNPNGAYIFSTNNSGEWQNDSAVFFSTTPSWANITKTLNSTSGTMVGYRWYFNDTSNNLNSTPVYVVTTTSSNIPPEIYSVTSISPVTLTDGPSPTFIIVNFSVYDANGASNLNSTSASINFTKADEELRYNSSCAVKDSSGNYANYTCNVTMWWWDASGNDWKVYANISDLDSNTVINDTTTFTVNTLTGFVMSPSSLNFDSLPAGSTNKTPTDYFILNNTGNANIGTNGVKINAIDLVGETNKNQFLWASNFSASIYTGGNIECNITASATQMVNKSDIAITDTILPSGNYTKNDGTGQENVYLCLRKVGVELTQQQYSTNQFGSWTVRIVLVAISLKRRKKKKNSNNPTSITLPVTIFSRELGILESLTKYMKENLGMSYHKIAELLNRNQRTIWTSYNKSIIKQKEIIQVKETEIFLPLSIFIDRKYTPLESIIIFLKKYELKYSEIAKLLNRNQKNIWTIYSKIKREGMLPE